ncbi:hypothetical protein Tco_0644570 [Tanacetum coccineum]
MIVTDVDVQNALKAKDKIFTTPRTTKSAFEDTTPVVSKTRYFVKTTQSVSLDTTSVVSRTKIAALTPLRARNKVVQIILWIVDSGCSKHMTGDRSLLKIFVEKFMGTVRFGNDHFLEGLGHHLFSVGKFSDGELEVKLLFASTHAIGFYAAALAVLVLPERLNAGHHGKSESDSYYLLIESSIHISRTRFDYIECTPSFSSLTQVLIHIESRMSLTRVVLKLALQWPYQGDEYQIVESGLLEELWLKKVGQLVIRHAKYSSIVPFPRVPLGNGSGNAYTRCFFLSVGARVVCRYMAMADCESSRIGILVEEKAIVVTVPHQWTWDSKRIGDQYSAFAV